VLLCFAWRKGESRVNNDASCVEDESALVAGGIVLYYRLFSMHDSAYFSVLSIMVSSVTAAIHHLIQDLLPSSASSALLTQYSIIPTRIKVIMVEGLVFGLTKDRIGESPNCKG
jgi:hypothetical protein